ncbi:MAG: tetratricopeptide repeat protein [Candidatus Melainabacteria bacterium]|nr:tetratricopeptide repeat protein [Candidatus Melainabacteria bacterium]
MWYKNQLLRLFQRSTPSVPPTHRGALGLCLICCLLLANVAGMLPAEAKKRPRQSEPVTATDPTSDTPVTEPNATTPATTPLDGSSASSETTPAPEQALSPQAEARTLYNQGVELFKISQVQAEKGNLPGQKKLLLEAKKRFEAALQLDNTLVEAQSNIGFVFLTLKDYRHAAEAFQKALKINENHLNTWNGLATTYGLDGKNAQALAAVDKLTTLDSSNVQFFFNKGSLLQKMGRFEDAVQAYQQALKLDPKDQRSLFNLGTLLENQGKPEEALSYYEKAKGIAIGNTIGLESIRRIKRIESLRQPASPPPTGSAPNASSSPSQPESSPQ